MSTTTSDAGGAMPAAAPTSRRRFLGALAATPALTVVPALAAAEGGDAELLALEAEIRRYHGEVQSIDDARIAPYAEEHDRLLGESVTKESMRAADEFSKRVGRDQAVAETWSVIANADKLTKRLFRTPAKTVAGRAAKVRILLAFVAGDEWRGPAKELDWEIDCARQMLGEFAGMTEAEIEAI